MSAKYTFRTKPYRHQARAIRFSLAKFAQGQNPALLMEPRTGKTKTTIDVAGCLYFGRSVRKVLIVCPNRVMGTWVREIAAHSPLTVSTVVWDSKARKNPIPDASAYQMQFVLVNYDAFATPGKKLPSGNRSKTTGRFKTRDMILKWVGQDDAMMVLDESHKIKSPSGKTSTMIVSMRDAFKYRMILTGTPVTKANRAHDIYMQWKFLNPNRFHQLGQTAEEFRASVGRWISSNGFPQWVGPREKGMEILKAGLARDAVIVKREECFDLPPRDIRIIDVPLTESRKHYDEMANTMITKIKDGLIAEASIPLVVTLRLLQLTSGFVSTSEVYERPGRKPKVVSTPHRVGSEKLAALKDILEEETLERDEKIVIAARFKEDMNAIGSLLRGLHVPYWSIRGGLTRAQTDEAIVRFRDYQRGAAAMVIQPSAASLGIDLSSANQMVWYSLTHSWVDYTQACDRIALSKRSTTFTYLLTPHSVDSLTYEALTADGEVAKAILANPDELRLS